VSTIPGERANVLGGLIQRRGVKVGADGAPRGVGYAGRALHGAVPVYSFTFAARTSTFSMTGVSAKSSEALAISAAAMRPLRCA